MIIITKNHIINVSIHYCLPPFQDLFKSRLDGKGIIISLVSNANATLDLLVPMRVFETPIIIFWVWPLFQLAYMGIFSYQFQHPNYTTNFTFCQPLILFFNFAHLYFNQPTGIGNGLEVIDVHPTTAERNRHTVSCDLLPI